MASRPQRRKPENRNPERTLRLGLPAAPKGHHNLARGNAPSEGLGRTLAEIAVVACLLLFHQAVVLDNQRAAAMSFRRSRSRLTSNMVPR